MHPGPMRGIVEHGGARKSPDIIHSGECMRADRGVIVVDNQKSIFSHSGYFSAVLDSLRRTASVLFLSYRHTLSRGYAVNFQLIILSSTI